MNQQHIFRIASWLFEELNHYKAIQEKSEVLKSSFPIPPLLYILQLHWTKDFSSPVLTNWTHQGSRSRFQLSVCTLLSDWWHFPWQCIVSFGVSAVYPQQIKENTCFTITMLQIIDAHTSQTYRLRPVAVTLHRREKFCSSLQTGGKGSISKTLGIEQINIIISNNLQPHMAT